MSGPYRHSGFRWNDGNNPLPHVLPRKDVGLGGGCGCRQTVQQPEDVTCLDTGFRWNDEAPGYSACSRMNSSTSRFQTSGRSWKAA